MKLTYDGVRVQDRGLGCTRLEAFGLDAKGRRRRLVVDFPRHRFEDFCYQLGLPMKYPDVSRAQREMRQAVKQAS